MRHALRHPIRFVRDHRFTVVHASDYLDDELDADGARRVDGHTLQCRRCRAMLEALRRTVSGVRGLRRPSRAGVAAGVLDALSADADGHHPS